MDAKYLQRGGNSKEGIIGLCGEGVSQTQHPGPLAGFRYDEAHEHS